MDRKKIRLIGGAVALVALVAGIWFLAKPGPKAPDYVTAHDRTLGSPASGITLIEYAAPICPHCARFNENIYPSLKSDYIDTGKILYVFRVFPLRPEDGAVEKLARCLPEDKYFAFMDQMFKNQNDWGPEAGVMNTRAAIITQAGKAGMSVAAAAKCMDDPALDDTINASAEEAYKKYGVNSTPSFILNGAKLNIDATDYTQLQAALDDAIANKQ